jgi:hypothetical protein
MIRRLFVSGTLRMLRTSMRPHSTPIQTPISRKRASAGRTRGRSGSFGANAFTARARNPSDISAWAVRRNP